MKIAILQVVDECPSGVTAAVHKEAKKRGNVECPAITAVEAVRNSKGLYQIKPEESEASKVELVGLKDPEQMTSEELVVELTAHGKAPRKRMKRETAVNYVKELRAKAVEMIIDDD